jgi:putative hydrolase of the HAD superfamily
LALLTNGFEVTQRIKIEASGIGEYVEFMVTSEALGVAKPNIEFFNHAMAKAGCKAEEVVYLGDTWDTDVEGGMGAELLTYWYHLGEGERQSENVFFGGKVNDLLAFARL